MQERPLTATVIIILTSMLLVAVVNFILSIMKAITDIKHKNIEKEKQEKMWKANEPTRNKFLIKYSLPESVLYLKSGEKDAIIAELPQIISGIYIYRSPSSKYNADDWIPYPNPAVIFIDRFAICTHTFDHCLEIVENLKVHGVNVAADPFELEEKLKMGRNGK